MMNDNKEDKIQLLLNIVLQYDINMRFYDDRFDFASYCVGEMIELIKTDYKTAANILYYNLKSDLNDIQGVM